MYACIYELRKNCCGWTGRDGTGGESKVLQEVLADLKTNTNTNTNTCTNRTTGVGTIIDISAKPTT